MRDYSNIPYEMKKENRWVLSKIVTPAEQKREIYSMSYLTKKQRDNELKKITKSKKIPIQTNGEYARINDNKTWTSFEQVENYLKRNPNNNLEIAFALGDGFLGIDIDDVKEELEKENRNEENIIREFNKELKTYGEISLSGTGVHFIGYGKLPGYKKRTGKFEMYEDKHFFTITGNRINKESIKDITEKLEPLYYKYIITKEELQKQRTPAQIDKNNNLTSSEILNIMFNKNYGSLTGQDMQNIYNGNWESRFESWSNADFFMAKALAYYSGGRKDVVMDLMERSGLMRKKWLQKNGLSTYGSITVDNAIKSITNYYKHQERKIELTKAQKFTIDYLANNLHKNRQMTHQINYISKNNYLGINKLILQTSKEALKYKSNIWLTYNQMQEINKTLPEGEKIKLKENSQGISLLNKVYKNIKTNEYINYKKYTKEYLQNKINTKEIITEYRNFYVYNADNFIGLPQIKIEEKEKIDLPKINITLKNEKEALDLYLTKLFLSEKYKVETNIEKEYINKTKELIKNNPEYTLKKIYEAINLADEFDKNYKDKIVKIKEENKKKLHR